MLPARHFQIAVSLLIAAGTVLFAVAPRLRVRSTGALAAAGWAAAPAASCRPPWSAPQ